MTTRRQPATAPAPSPAPSPAQVAAVYRQCQRALRAPLCATTRLSEAPDTLGPRQLARQLSEAHRAAVEAVDRWRRIAAALRELLPPPQPGTEPPPEEP
jgi:hypothetical protein